jgi:hypothetical protein
MRKRSIVFVTALLLMLTVTSGCLWAPDLDRVRQEIEIQLPGAHFQKEFALSLGPVTLGLARAVTAVVPRADLAGQYLRDIRRVKVAVYKVKNVPRFEALRTPEHLTALLETDDWELAVRVHERRDEAVWVLCRADDNDKLREVYVVALTGDELVLVRASGNIERLVAKAMKERRAHGDFDVREFL